MHTDGLSSELRKQAQAWAERTAVEQGLPPKVEDPVVIARVATIFRESEPTSKTDERVRRRPKGGGRRSG